MLAGRIAQTIAPYPTYSLGLRIAAARLFGEFRGGTWRPAQTGQRSRRLLTRATCSVQPAGRPAAAQASETCCSSPPSMTTVVPETYEARGRRGS